MNYLNPNFYATITGAQHLKDVGEGTTLIATLLIRVNSTLPLLPCHRFAITLPISSFNNNTSLLYSLKLS